MVLICTALVDLTSVSIPDTWTALDLYDQTNTLISSGALPTDINSLELYYSGDSVLYIGYGADPDQLESFQIHPNTDANRKILLNQGMSMWVKASTATAPASSGELAINFMRGRRG